MSKPKTTQNDVPTSTTGKAWHDRAAGDLRTWADGYNPRSERAAEVWNTHRDALEPWISAAPAAGVTEARRVASAVLELLAWAMPLVNDLDEALSEESLQRFVRANPTALGDGALGNVRGRVRRVLKARAALTAASSSHGGASSRQAPATEYPTSNTSDEPSPADVSSLVYTDETWSRLATTSADDAALAASLRSPDGVSTSEWAHARAVAKRLGVDLTKAQVRRTRHVHALNHPISDSLAVALRDVGATRRTATEAASLLAPVDEELYRKVLRGEAGRVTGPRRHEAAHLGDCTTASRTHGDANLDASAEAAAPVHPTPGGSTTVPTNLQSASPENTHPEAGEPDARVRRRRKPSARQMRLALAAAIAEREARTASMPESMRTYIREEYIPLEPVRPQWDHLKGAVEATLAASSVRGDDSMRKHVTHLAYYFHWARSVDLPLEPSTLTRENIGRYDTEELVNGSKSTRQTRRSRLMAMADQIHPDDAPVKGPPLAHRSVAPPYTSREMAVIRRVAQVQPSDLLVRQMCLLVGLGAGAGVDSTDIKRLRDGDVIDHGPDMGIEVHVTNLRRSGDNVEKRSHRTVWVLREYEDLVRIGLEGAKRGHLLLGREAERANVAASVFSRAVLSKDVPDLAQARLRSTWMATHLQRTTPLNVLLQAAGLTTARTLVDLLAHVPAAADEQLLR